MSLGINTNIASLSAQRALSSSQADAATAMQRLSTGLRINSAKDDAAGLAISNSMTSRVNGLSVAGRNANDAVSMLQTAEGGLQSITDNLQRIRELAVQASSDNLGSTERGYLNTEVSQLISEINRVADSTTFNGQALLNGTGGVATDGVFTFQIGEGTTSNDNFSVTLSDHNTTQMGATTGTATLTGTALQDGDLGAGDVKIALGSGSAVDVGAVTRAGSGGSYAAGVASAIQTAQSGVTATVGASSYAMGAFTTISGGASTGDTYSLSVEGVAIFSTEQLHDGSSTNTITAAEMDAAILAKASDLTTAGVSYTGSARSGDLVFSKADGSDLVIVDAIVDDSNDVVLTGGFANIRAMGTETSVTKTGYGSLTLTAAETITLSGNAALDEAKIGFADGASAAVSGTTVANISVTTRALAQAAITSVDDALATVNSSRATIGANQSRLESVIDAVAIAVENSQSARSRILDADFAEESAALAKTQVLQQAGISVLAQANAMPQQVLALLQ